MKLVMLLSTNVRGLLQYHYLMVLDMYQIIVLVAVKVYNTSRSQQEMEWKIHTLLSEKMPLTTVSIL